MKNRRVWLLVLLVLTVGCDHATKAIASGGLDQGKAVSVVPGVLNLELHHNHGIAFNLERWLPAHTQRPIVFAAGMFFLALLVFVWWRRSGDAPAEHVAYALIVAGALGNLSDRIVRGYVVDFIHVPHWPIFNVADIAVVAGAGLLWWSQRKTNALAV